MASHIMYRFLAYKFLPPHQSVHKIFMASHIMYGVIFFLMFCHVSLSEGLPPALFIFGDSLVDVGNTNRLLTYAKANFPPFGMNFDTHLPTGRFSDGRLIPDYISSFMGLPFVPAYLEAGDNILGGVNFGVCASGIYPTTGARLGLNVPLSKQVNNFELVKAMLDIQIGPYASSELISKSLFYIGIGNNDFANNYYQSPSLQASYTVDEFESELLNILTEQIERLHAKGAKQFVVTSLAAIGCNPESLYAFRVNRSGDCASSYQRAGRSYNKNLQSTLRTLERSLNHSNVLYGDLSSIMLDVIRTPRLYGFTNVNKPCCTDGQNSYCYPYAPTCSNSSKYLFWDMFHPTSAFNQLAATRFWSGSNEDIAPRNVKILLGHK